LLAPGVEQMRVGEIDAEAHARADARAGAAVGGADDLDAGEVEEHQALAAERLDHRHRRLDRPAGSVALRPVAYGDVVRPQAEHDLAALAEVERLRERHLDAAG